MLRPVRLLRYGVAVGSVALALVLTLLLQSLLAPTVLPLFFLAVTFSTWYGGRGAGFAATVLSVLVTRYFLLPPLYTFLPIHSAAIAELIIFSLTTLLISRLEVDLRLVHHRNRRHLIDLEKTEAALRESDARFHAAAESSFDAIYILRSVRNRVGEIVDFQFVDLNEHGAKLISRTKAEVVGKNLCELLPINLSQGFFEKYKQVVEMGIPLVEEFPSHTMPGVAASWLHHQVVPLGDGIAITTRDISERKQAEEALKASEALYRTLAEAMPQLVWTQNAEGKVDYANQQWQQALGVTLTEVDREGWEHLVHPDDLPHLQAKEATSMRDSDVREAEFRYRMADGSYRWFLGRCVPVKGDRGQVVKWVGTSTDIDDLKRYEQELARRKQRFKTLADNSPDIIARMDHNFRHVYINAAITRATGLPPEAFIGKTNADLNMPIYLRNLWQERMQQVFVTGQPCSYEFEFPAPDGTRYYFARLVPEFAPNGMVESILCITSDFTEVKQVERSLRDSEIRFRRVMESNMIGMGFWTIAGAISDANDALLRLLGYTREQFLAEQPGWRVLTPSEYAELDERALAEIRETGVCPPFEKEFFRRDGSRVPVLCGGATFQDTIESGVFFVLDLSDRRQAEMERDRLMQLERAARTEAEAANRIKDEFLMVLSHELRTPLNPILGWTKLLRTRHLPSEMVDQALETIDRNARQQAQLIEDLLDVSRILQGKLTMNCCPVHLVEVIEGAIATVWLSAQAKSIAIETQLDVTVPAVLGNQERLQQVMWNLLSNAVKFTPERGRVQVRLETIEPESVDENSTASNLHSPTATYAQITVRDTGKGISSDFLPYVFDYFRQADGTSTRSVGGLGLGLAIARHLVELHGGTIEVASEGIGKGAVFTVRLPVHPDEPDSPVDALQHTTPEAMLQAKQVLLVGTADDTQALIAATLQQAGATVTVVTSTEAVLQELARSQPDVLVSTLEALRDNDDELMHRLRLWTQAFGEAIPVVALASDPNEGDSQEILTSGIQRILSGAIEPDELVEAIARLML
ncbi:PAS domain S-box protein [Oscillatoria sp. FACHB-1407]|uniref:PAS domain S-box protein n=1 Tax=Oscillatoria sp. FACHB-1407 TaxID=2692847 RepID=UPI001689994B|nr:PAS domain S-box protein [Oscillatoria sp. FACHB-1407]MBD2459736.1 PAS domain S-box protein [Oscillatoria sp. FACHB-1407]